MVKDLLKKEPTVAVKEPVVQEAPSDLVVERAAPPGEKLTLPEALVPKVVDQSDLPRKPYWVGTCHGAPFHSTRIAGIEFPKHSFENIANVGPSNHKLGTLLMLTDQQIEEVMKKSVMTGWRRNIVEKRGKDGKKRVISDTWKSVHYDANNPPIANDRLTANFVYMRKLKIGQRIPIGVKDENGDDFKTPDPLRELR